MSPETALRPGAENAKEEGNFLAARERIEHKEKGR